VVPDAPKPRRTVSVGPVGGVLIVVGVVAGLRLAGALQAMIKKVEKFGQDRNMTLWVNQFGDS